ncbi:cytochrome-c peroxidase [Algirhabdus cladophorae]|uniref:cytochrome-c peroxidase n=1 Tax=Algirhabdus cladophorae TaxID=3377108 RepID=UPI003B84A593
MRAVSAFAVLCLGGAFAPVSADTLPKADALFPDLDMKSVKLGQLLFYDPILSGNKSVACATCHHPDFATADGVSLGIGDGGIGLGPNRKIDPDNPPEERVPRHAPALFNLGTAEFSVMFHDGRLEADSSQPHGLRTPLGGDMVAGFKSVLSAQAMFPVLSPDEMAGHYGENDISTAVRQGRLSHEGGAWDILSGRITEIPEYRQRFDAVIGANAEIEFTDIANVIADFIAFEWRADDSPFDRYLRGEAGLSDTALAGMELFYGPAGCSSCHSGQFQTDHGFHAIAVPQIGPGKAPAFLDHMRDDGRMAVTGQIKDQYAFRTPSLRNVAQTAPYGHSGAYATLEGIVGHHTAPTASLEAYDQSQAIFPVSLGHDDWSVQNSARERAEIATANQLRASPMRAEDMAQIIAFLESLSDPVSLTGRLGIPETVPSGLPLDPR